MNRLIAILIVILLFFMVYIWINSMTSKGDSKPSDKPVAAATSGTEDSEKEYRLSNYDPTKKGTTASEKKNRSETESTSGDSVTSEEDANANESKGEAEEQKSTQKPPVKQKGKQADQSPTRVFSREEAQNVKGLSAGSQHLVIVGNFINRANAEKRADQLKLFGYERAEVVNFDLSEYHTVCAGRFSDLYEAQRIAKYIRDHHKLEAYVRVGK